MATTKNYLDYSGLSKYDELLKTFVSNTYVAKETGKSLMTDAQATKLAGIDTGAQVNVIESISVKGNGGGVTTPTVTGKGVTIDISAYALSSEVTDEANRALGAESALVGKINAIFTPASEGNDASGSVVTYVASEIKKVNDAASTLAGKVTANENAIATLNGDAETSGSVAHTVDTEITKLINGAPAAFDTLKEIADWIGSGEVASTTAANMLADINKLKGGETVEGSVAKALKDAKTYTDGKIGTIPTQEGQASTTVVAYVDAKVLAEKTRALGVENGLDTRLANIEKSLGSSEKAMGERVTALETTVGNANSGLVKGVADNKTAIAAANTKITAMDAAYKDADTKLQEAIDAIKPIELTGENSIASLFPAG